MDSIAFMEWMKENEQSKSIPVFVTKDGELGNEDSYALTRCVEQAMTQSTPNPEAFLADLKKHIVTKVRNKKR